MSKYVNFSSVQTNRSFYTGVRTEAEGRGSTAFYQQLFYWRAFSGYWCS